jgi:hypothetical protein
LPKRLKRTASGFAHFGHGSLGASSLAMRIVPSSSVVKFAVAPQFSRSGQARN